MGYWYWPGLLARVVAVAGSQLGFAAEHMGYSQFVEVGIVVVVVVAAAAAVVVAGHRGRSLWVEKQNH